MTKTWNVYGHTCIRRRFSAPLNRPPLSFDIARRSSKMSLPPDELDPDFNAGNPPDINLLGMPTGYGGVPVRYFHPFNVPLLLMISIQSDPFAPPLYVPHYNMSGPQRGSQLGMSTGPPAAPYDMFLNGHTPAHLSHPLGAPHPSLMGPSTPVLHVPSVGRSSHPV